MSAADKEQYIESAEMAMDWNDTNEPAISKIEHMVYENLLKHVLLKTQLKLKHI